MSESWTLVAGFVGGLGLFMLGMRLMTDGLKVAAGQMLRDVLARWTRTRLRGLFAGMAITALVQSSSAVTVATIGFVNAGLLTLAQALWVAFGSNVGTTMTAWLVAATGFDVDLEALALPMIGIGMLLKLTGAQKRRGAFGEAIAGFGLFFLGLEVLSTAFAGLGAETDLSALGVGGGPLAVLSFLGIGTLLTVVVQSSSAALALTITAAAGGVLDLSAAGAMVIGANLGTTSTALFAAIGATPAAKRTVAGHIAFNLVAAVAALLLLPWLLDALTAALAFTGGDTVAAVLALFHTTFNVLGVLLMWPLSDRLERALAKRFVTEEERKGEPRHLDATILQMPTVALDALTREMARLGRHAGEIVALALAPGPPVLTVMERRRVAFERLVEAIGSTITALDRHALSDQTSEGLSRLIRVSRHYLTSIEQAQTVAQLREEAVAAHATGARLDGELGQALRELVRLANPEREQFSLPECEQALGVVNERYEKDRARLLDAAAHGAEKARASMRGYHLLAEMRRAVRHLVNAAEDLEPLRGR